MTVTTEASTTTEVVATVKAKDLIRILSNASVFAGKDDTLPALCAVRLEADGHELTAIATDRYTLATDTAELGEVKAEFSTLVGLPDVKRIVDTVKPWASPKYDAEATVTVSESMVTVSVYDSALSVRPVDAEFPRWRAIFPPDECKAEVGGIGMNPKLLARLAKVDGGAKNLPARFTFYSDRKPAVATIGDTFVVAIMPVRH